MSWNRLQKNAGRKSNEDVVLSSDHVVLMANGFPRLNICVRPPSLFREQMAYPPILNYRSVNPILPILSISCGLSLERAAEFNIFKRRPMWSDLVP